MSMVEGIGDEVLQFFAIIIILALALLAWWSTSISEGPIRTVLILERRTRSRLTNDLNPPPSVTFTGSNENSIDTGQVDTANIQELVENDGPDLTGGLSSNNTDDKEDESSSSLLLPTNQPPASVNINNETTDNGSSNQNNDELLQSQAPQVEVVEQQSLRECESADNNDSDPFILRRRRIAFFQSRGPTLLESTSSSSEPENEQETPSVMQDSDNAQDDTDSMNPDHIRIRLKYLNDDQIVVEGRLHEQLGDFKRRHFSIELAAEKMVRLIFNGQVLQSDSQTLQGYGLFDNCVVHCLVHNQRNNAPRAAQTQTNGTTNQSTPPDWNLGTLLYACLSFILGFAWYCRYQYSHLFTVTTTAALFGLTGMFVVTVLSINLPDHDALQ